MLLLSIPWAIAQTTPTDAETKAKIRKIKLSEQYIYTDAMSANSFDEARDMAVEELRIQVSSLLAEEGKGEAFAEEAMRRMDMSSKLLQYKQMGMFKVFAYIDKNILTSEATAEKQAETPAETPAVTAGQPATQEAVPADSAALATTPATPTAVPEMEQEDSFTLEDTDSTAVVTLPDTTAVVTLPDTTAVAALPDTTAVAEAAEQEAVRPTKAIVTTPVSETVETDSLFAPQLRIIGDLLALDSYEGIMLYLNAMKEDGRLMYGRISTLIRPEEAYLIIVKDGKLVTVLDQGDSGERANLRTHQQDNIRNYKGYAVIWLKVFDKK